MVLSGERAVIVVNHTSFLDAALLAAPAQLDQAAAGQALDRNAARDGGVEVVVQLLRLGLLAEDLAEDGDLALELGIQRLILARIQLDDGGIRNELDNVLVVAAEALAGHHKIRFCGHD